MSEKAPDQTPISLTKKMARKPDQLRVKALGSKLQNLLFTKDALVNLLKQAATFLSKLEQEQPARMLKSMQPFLNAVIKPELLKHQDEDVKLLVATCICEIMRITAPEAPYSDDVLKDIFHLIFDTFGGLCNTSGPPFDMRVVILDTVARCRLCVLMLDLECDDLVNKMFSKFFAVVSEDHPESVLSSIQTIMIILLEESDKIQEDLLFTVLSVLGRYKSDVSTSARRLAMNVIEKCAEKLEAGIKQFLMSSMSGDSKSVKYQLDHHEVIYDVYRCAPQIITGVAPYLRRELKSDQLDTRLKAVDLVGSLLYLPSSTVSEAFQPIFSEFLKRLTDRVLIVRMSVLEHVKSCLLSNASRPEVPQITSALYDRLLDVDEKVRKQVIAIICDVACHDLSSIPVESVKLVAERLRDKSLLVKKYTMERLAEIYRVYCVNCANGSIKSNEFDWIPGKILRCFFDKDFRSDTIESVLCGSLFPTEFPMKDKVHHWVRAFSGFDKVEVKALEKIMVAKAKVTASDAEVSVSQAELSGTFMSGVMINYPNLHQMKARKKEAKEAKKKGKAELSEKASPAKKDGCSLVVPTPLSFDIQLVGERQKKKREVIEESKPERREGIKQMHSLAVSKDAAFQAVSSFILPTDEAILPTMGTEKTHGEWTSHMGAAMEAGVMFNPCFEERVKSLASIANQEKGLEEQSKKKAEAEKGKIEEALSQVLERVRQLEAELVIKSKEVENSIALKDAEIAELKDMVANQYTDATLRTRYELFKEY